MDGSDLMGWGWIVRFIWFVWLEGGKAGRGRHGQRAWTVDTAHYDGTVVHYCSGHMGGWEGGSPGTLTAPWVFGREGKGPGAGLGDSFFFLGRMRLVLIGNFLGELKTC